MWDGDTAYITYAPASPLILAIGASSCSRSNQQIECAVAKVDQAVGSLQEAPAQTKALTDGLGRGSENEITGTAARIRARHPGATEDQIVNYLVTAYCPTINRNGALDKTGKQQAMQSFATRVEKLVHPVQ